MDKDWIWWKHGVIYHIYPRSFYDSNKDGIGDIPGIIQKIDYFCDLGIDALWLSPINQSPMCDFGYDISDYREIDPIFGTRENFLELIKEAHSRNIRIIMDLVMNHTSDLHPWFLLSRSSCYDKKRNWYIWRDGNKNYPPNNWQSSFGGSAWKWDDSTRQYYLHSFFNKQPDLNWHNKDLKQAIFDEAMYWLDQGVDGFRLDAINWLIKDKYFRNNPTFLGISFLQRHEYDRNRAEVHDILKEFRSIVNSYNNRVLVGEVFTLPPGNPELSASFLGNGEDELHLAFDFSIMYRRWDAFKFYKTVQKWLKNIPAKGWPCHVLSNHDQERSISRYNNSKDGIERAKVAAAFLLTLKGTPFIYYGEEIGMRNGKISKSEICDPLGKRFWPFYNGRDPSRTPMQWSSEINAGFTEGSPWLPVNSNYKQINVLSQRTDKNSIYNFYKSLIHLHKKKASLYKGEWIPVLKGYKGVLGYFREFGDEKIFIALNFTFEEKQVSISERGKWKVLLSTHKSTDLFFTTLNFILSPYEATIIEKVGELL